jgi:hypothetical protein
MARCSRERKNPPGAPMPAGTRALGVGRSVAAALVAPTALVLVFAFRLPHGQGF